MRSHEHLEILFSVPHDHMLQHLLFCNTLEHAFHYGLIRIYLKY